MSIVETVYEKLKTAPPEVTQQVLDFLEFLESQRQRSAMEKSSPSWDDLMGSLANAKAFAGDPVEIQRQLRDEWAND
jgi:Protein of unknown function (DUF2281)